MRIWWRAGLVLVVVWLVAALAVFIARSVRPTAAGLVEYIGANPLENLDPARREAVIARVATTINRLEFDQRQKLREMRVDRSFFEQMTQQERVAFLDATLPQGFRNLMEALNKMDAKDRQRIVQRALNDIERDAPELAGRLDTEDAQKLISQGLQSFYEEASAEVKLDFAPVIERLQKATQGLR